MKEAANVWEYKVGINATFCLFVNMLIYLPITPHDQRSQKCSPLSQNINVLPRNIGNAMNFVFQFNIHRHLNVTIRVLIKIDLSGP